MEPKLVSKSTVLKRDGWTNKAIELFLPIPDKEVPNPHYKKAAPMKLYQEDKVIRVENTNEFIIFKGKSSHHRNNAQKAVRTKTDKIIEYVNNLIVEVPILSKDELIKNACNHFNYRLELKQEKYDDWWWRKGQNESKEDGIYEPIDFQNARPNSDPVFLTRICVNYLRHCLTRYEKELNLLFGKVGKDNAYLILKEKINEAILDTYPWMKFNVEK